MVRKSVTEETLHELFKLDKLGLTIQMDENALLFWRTAKEPSRPLSEMPWKYQLPFYLTFLHDDRLAEKFKDLEVIGAIDCYIKGTFLADRSMELSHKIET